MLSAQKIMTAYYYWRHSRHLKWTLSASAIHVPVEILGTYMYLIGLWHQHPYWSIFILIIFLYLSHTVVNTLIIGFSSWARFHFINILYVAIVFQMIKLLRSFLSWRAAAIVLCVPMLGNIEGCVITDLYDQFYSKRGWHQKLTSGPKQFGEEPSTCRSKLKPKCNATTPKYHQLLTM